MLRLHGAILSVLAHLCGGRASPTSSGHTSLSRGRGSTLLRAAGNLAIAGRARQPSGVLGRVENDAVKQLNDRVIAARSELDNLLLSCHTWEDAELPDLLGEVTQNRAEMNGNMAMRDRANEVAEEETQRRDRLQGDLLNIKAQCDLQLNTLRAQTALLQHEMQAESTLQALILGQRCAQRHSKQPCARGLRHQHGRRRRNHAARSLQQKSRGLRGARRGMARYLAGKVRHCSILAVQLRRVFANLEAQFTNMKLEETKVAERCQQQLGIEEARIQESERREVEANQELSVSMGELGTLTLGRDAKQQEWHFAVGDLKEDRQDCTTRANILAREVADALSLRKALVRRVRDCEVSQWTWKPCSQRCTPRGSSPGVREGTREILLPPDQHGVECPALQAKLPCGTRPCPQDCQMDEWEAWTACSSACGGGIRARARRVEIEPRHGGADCPMEEEREMCNVGACDVDCQLDGWSDWSSCSRACRFSREAAAGRQRSVRRVRQAAEGAGHCPDEEDAARSRERQCNEELCDSNSTCIGSQEVFVLLDGSDSANFSAQLLLLRGLVQHSAGSMQFGALAYGSSVRLLSEVTLDHARLLQVLTAAEAPGGNPDLAAGEAFAKNLIVSGDAVGIGGLPLRTVLLLTDGAPTDFSAAVTVASRLRDQGIRLVVGLVDGGSPSTRQEACQLVDKPCATNVEAVESWEQLAESPWQFLAALCDRLLTPPQVVAALDVARFR